MSRADVLLVSCYELGHQPQALAWARAFLERAGHACRSLDLAVEPFSTAAAAEARLVAISVPMHTALRLGLRAAERVRALNPRAHVCFFGLYAWLNAEALLAGPADAVLAGEAEPALVGLADDVLAGRPLRARDGLATTSPPGAARRERLDFPVPQRAGLPPLERYAGLVDAAGEVRAGYTEASRGCLHTCRHCPVVPVYGGRFFAVPVDVVMADVGQQVAAGARHISFGDPDFLNGPTHALRVARALHAEHPAVGFDFTAKVEHLLRHQRLLPELVACGARFAVSAVESLSDLVLERLGKGHTSADAERLVAAMDAAGLPLRPTFVAFTPWTSLEDYLAQLDFVERHGLVESVPPIQHAIRLLVPAGSPLRATPGAARWLGRFDPARLGHRWSHPDPRVDALHREVEAIVAAAEAGGEDDASVFLRLREAAHRAAGRPEPRRPEWPRRRGAAPRLTEHWFC